MEQKPKSEGKCLFCSETFTKAGISYHLKTHLEEKAASGKAGISYLLKIEPNPRQGFSPYFLSLWIDGETTMKQLDQFLRDIWLECCGHESAFISPRYRRNEWIYSDAIRLLERGKKEEYKKLMEESIRDIPMSQETKDVFHKDLKLRYEYDFVNPTKLVITVIGEFPVKADEEIVLLSRNEPLERLCDQCKKEKAIQICTLHIRNGNAYFCDKCGEKHTKKCEDFADNGAMGVANSPRMGVCVYSGSEVDMKRNGVEVSDWNRPWRKK